MKIIKYIITMDRIVFREAADYFTICLSLIVKRNVITILSLAFKDDSVLQMIVNSKLSPPPHTHTHTYTLLSIS